MVSNIFALLFTTLSGIFSFSLPAINGGSINLNSYAGKKLLIVNIATQCPTAQRQLQELKQLQTQYAATLQVIAVPSNDFNNLEPDADSSIAVALQGYQLNFPVAQRQKVSGQQAHPLFQWLENLAQNGVMDTRVRWTYTKFLVGANGQLLDVFDPDIYAMDELLRDAVEQ